MPADELFDLAAERQTLGALILDNQQIDPVRLILSKNDFYRPANGALFEAIGSLWMEEEPVDLTTLSNKLQQKGILEEIGGRLYLASLLEQVMTGSNAPYHAKIVRQYAIRRQLSHIGSEVAYLAKDMTLEPEEILEKANEKLYSLSNLQSEPEPLSNFFGEVLARAETGRSDDYESGFPDIDRLCSLQKGQLLVIAGETSFGKTTLALDLAYRLCQNLHPVIIFSLEMSRQEIAQRWMAKAARLPLFKYGSGKLNPWERDKLVKALERMQLKQNYPAVYDQSDIGIDDLYAWTRPFFRKRADRAGVLIVDYIGLVHGPKKENRNQEVAYVVRRLKQLARQLNIFVIGLAQLSRNVVNRKNRKPELSDLRESGEIEQTADLVWLLYRTETDTRLHIAKQRNGPTGEVSLIFRPDFVSFESALKPGRPSEENLPF